MDKDSKGQRKLEDSTPETVTLVARPSTQDVGRGGGRGGGGAGSSLAG